MKYANVAEARAMDGLKLVLSVQTPGPWGIAARAVFDLRSVHYVPVRQDVMQPNEDLVAWTGCRNAPVAVLDDEPPADGWLEIVNLAQRLGSGASLWPDDPVERALAVGFSSEICGQEGFGWSRRIALAAAPPEHSQAVREKSDSASRFNIEYGIRSDAVNDADQRVAQIMAGLAAQLQAQKRAGSAFLVGNRLSACDIHWACFSILVAPLDQSECVLADELRVRFANLSDRARDALHPVLIEHRDMVWRDYIGLPLDYLPD